MMKMGMGWEWNEMGAFYLLLSRLFAYYIGEAE